METLTSLGDYSGLAGLTLIAFLVITRRLVWYKDLQRVERRADRLEELLFQSLGVSEKIVTTAEKAVSREVPGGGAK